MCAKLALICCLATIFLCILAEDVTTVPTNETDKVEQSPVSATASSDILTVMLTGEKCYV
uniref:Widespread mucin n=1 Tax=Ascaris lumbricoides TaxID=6252 RepID=A0A0M3IEG1_ASCLU